MKQQLNTYEVQRKKTTTYVYRIKASSPRVARSIAASAEPSFILDDETKVTVKKVETQKGKKQ